ncbi:MAG TPA: transporter substrate-binding domain-containing protein [Deltaproteobacteria bacterium]|nr:transporter substrate-binding domain-containing protein [Deltaproteobacteria bacterium]
MKKVKVIIMLIMALALVSGCVHTKQGTGPEKAVTVLDSISQKGVLVVGTAGSMPPFNMTTREGDVIGFEPDMAKLMAQEMGVKLKFEVMPFSELLPALEAGKVNLILSQMTMTGKRNMKVAFVGPYSISGKSFVTKIKWIASVKEASQVNSPKTTVVVLKGSTSEAFVKKNLPKAKFVQAMNYDDAVEMVLKGKVDAMIADYPICVLTILRNPDQGLISVITPLSYEPIGIALPGNDPLMVNWMENFLGTLGETGVLDLLKERWVNDNSWLKKLP